MLPIKEFYSINEGDKDSLYYDRMIRFLRYNMLPLINIDDAKLGMDYLLGYQDMSATEDLFTDPSQLNLQNTPVAGNIGITDLNGNRIGSARKEGLRREMKGVGFKSLPVLYKAYNIVLAEMKKAGVNTTVRANDPTSTVARKHDEALLKNRREIEGFLSYIYASGGNRPVKMSEHKDRFGEKADMGNTDLFDKMGFDPDDPDDVGFFMDTFHKLDEEIEMEKALHAIEGFNEIQTNKIPKWTTDAIAKNAVAGLIYVSDDGGAIINEYLSPETVFIYGSTGRREDYNDAMAKCYQQSITVKQFLDRVGDAFDWDKDVNNLMIAIFYASSGSIDITGINPDYKGAGYGNDWFCRDKANVSYSHDNFMSFKVVLGYIEWSGQDYTEYGKSLKGQKFGDKKDVTPDNSPTDDNQAPNGERYQTKARYECPTYKSYYLALTAYTHIKYEAGKVTYQHIKGYNDFNSNFSIVTWKGIGDPIAILAIPMIDTINEAYYKWRWILRRSKAPGMAYNMESIEKMAEIMFGNTDSKDNKIAKMIQHMDSSSNYLWSFPEIDGKPTAMGNSQLNIEIANGMKKESMIYWDIIISQWDKLIDMLIGSSDLRQGDSAQGRQSMNNEFKALEYSQNSTSFIPDMITFMCRGYAIRNGLFIQDIIQFKNYDTLAYKWLENIVGEECLDKIELMGKTSMYRYGITVESLNQSAARQRLAQRVDMALQAGKIELVQALLVEDIKSPNLAIRTLAYFEYRNKKLAQKAALQQQQQQQQGQMQIEQMKMQQEKLKADTSIGESRIQADATIQSHIINQQGGMAKAMVKLQGDVQQIYEQLNADLKRESMNTAQAGTPNPPTSPVPQGPPPGSPLPPPVQNNAMAGQQPSFAQQ